MSVIDELAVNVVAKTNKLASSLRQASSMFGSFGKNLNSTIPGLTSFNALLGGISLGGMAVGFTATADALEGMMQTADRLGMTTKEFAALQMGAQWANIEVQTFEKAMMTLSKNLGNAAQGSQAAAKGFQALGLDINRMLATDAPNRLAEIADRLNRLETPAQRSAVAMQIFGKAGFEMQKMLAGGSAGIQDMIAAADKMGMTLNDEALQRVVKFNDAMDELRSLISVTAQEIVITITPTALEAVELLRESPGAVKALTGALGAQEGSPSGSTVGGLMSFMDFINPGAVVRRAITGEESDWFQRLVRNAGASEGTGAATRDDIQRHQLRVQQQQLELMRRSQLQRQDSFSIE